MRQVMNVSEMHHFVVLLEDRRCEYVGQREEDESQEDEPSERHRRSQRFCLGCVNKAETRYDYHIAALMRKPIICRVHG
jgi:hypothetical protein